MTHRSGDQSPRAYDHVVFDLDGTLVDSRVDLAAAINHMRAMLRLPPLPVETICGYIGEGARLLVQRSLGPAVGVDWVNDPSAGPLPFGSLHRSESDRLLGSANEQQLEQALALFFDYYGEHLLDHTRPYPGIAETLAALHARGVQLSVLSNKPETMSRAILAGLGLLPYFTLILGGDTLSARKPDPVGIRHLCELSGTPPERMLFVGDSGVDLETARAAGVAFCGVTWGLRPREVSTPEAGRLIHQPKQLLEVVERG